MIFKQIKGEINPDCVSNKVLLVKQLSRKGKDEGKIDVLRTYKFEGIYPNAVSSIPLDYGATDQIEEFQVTFNYLFWEVADSKPAMTAKAQTTT